MFLWLPALASRAVLWETVIYYGGKLWNILNILVSTIIKTGYVFHIKLM